MATLLATQLRNNTNFLMDGEPYRVVKYAHQKIGRGGATVKVSARNLQTGNLEDKTFQSTTKFEAISTIKRPLQYLYNDNQNAVFMDGETYEQIEIDTEVLGSDLAYLKEGSNVDVLFWDEKPLSVDLPPKVNLEVAETAPGVKGNSASNMYKSATLENGLSVKVPLFIKTGDKVRVDTRTGEYIERVTN